MTIEGEGRRETKRTEAAKREEETIDELVQPVILHCSWAAALIDGNSCFEERIEKCDLYLDGWSLFALAISHDRNSSLECLPINQPSISLGRIWIDDRS